MIFDSIFFDSIFDKKRRIPQPDQAASRAGSSVLRSGRIFKMRFAKTLTVILVAFSLSASACQQGPNKELVGTLAGAALGGYVGSTIGKGKGQLAAVAVGTLAGGMIGGSIGESLDEVDRMKMNQAVQQAQAAPVGQQITWNNPDSGNSGSVKAVRDGWSDSGEYCRQFEQVVQVGEQREQEYGTACRGDDGSWAVLP